MLRHLLYTIAVAIFSALLVAYAYDVAQGYTIDAPSSAAGVHEVILSVATFLGFRGSVVVGCLATGFCLLLTVRQGMRKKKAATTRRHS